MQIVFSRRKVEFFTLILCSSSSSCVPLSMASLSSSWSSGPISISEPESPNSNASVDHSVETLLLYFEELRLKKEGKDINIQSSTPRLSHNSGVDLDNVPPKSAGSVYRSRPLNSQIIGAYDYRGDFLLSYVHSGMGNLLDSLNYGNICNLDQQNNYPGNLSGAILDENHCNLASQFEVNPFLNNPVSMVQGRSDSLFNDNLFVYQNNAGENSCADPLYKAIGRESLDLPNGSYPCFVPPTSGNSFGLHDLTFFNSLRSVDIAWLAMGEYGLQHFQNMLDSNDPIIRNKIAKAVLEYLFELMTDQYGTRLFHKLIKSRSITELEPIFAKLIFPHESLIRVSQTQYGSRSVQKLIKEFRRSPLIREVASALAKGVYTLMIDEAGKNVIFQCFNLLDSYKKEPLSEAVVDHCFQLSMHEVGCICLTRCIDYISGLHRDRLLNKIAENSVCFAMDPSGNYVLQQVLILQNPIITDKICSHLHGSYILLSYLKCGSHVVEKCLKSSGMKYAIQELLASNQLGQLARDKFGNYVVQTALRMTKHADPDSHQCLLRSLKPHKQSLELHRTGKIVHNLIENGVPLRNDVKREGRNCQ